MSAIYDGGPAFPCVRPQGPSDHGPHHYSGMTVRDYLIAHAPAEPQPWFGPVVQTQRPEPVWPDGPKYMREPFPSNVEEISAWDGEYAKQRYIQWPAAWADEQLKLRRQS